MYTYIFYLPKLNLTHKTKDKRVYIYKNMRTRAFKILFFFFLEAFHPIKYKVFTRHAFVNIVENLHKYIIRMHVYMLYKRTRCALKNARYRIIRVPRRYTLH